MKKSLIYFGAAFLLLGTVGCSEDYLEPVRNTQTLTNEDFANNAEINPALVEGTLNGIYTFMTQPFGAVGGARHYDIGHKGLDIWSDMVSGNMALSGNAYNWYGATSNLLATVDFTREENTIIWNYLYRVVSLSNIVIENLGGNDIEPETSEARAMMGQAKALRAYGYFYLTQLFQRGYNPAQEILPLYDGVQSLTTKQPAADIYALIISDLNHSISLLDGFQRQYKHQINKSVAQGLLAYTYAAMGQYDQVKTLADDIIATGGFSLTTTGQLAFPGAGSGFNDVNTPSWMWGYDLTTDLGYNLVSWWGQMCVFTYSYQWAGDRKSMDNALFNQMPDNDVRRTQFGSYDGSTLLPYNKFFHPGRAVGGQQVVETDYLYMRIEEFYLLSAEAAAKTGNEAAAKTRLVEMLSSRLGGEPNATAYVNPLSGAALRDAIYLQTRLELWGEGKSYFAMKRNQATVTRGTNHVFLPGVSIPYDDDRLSFQIPANEINNNPGITEQN